MITLSEKRLHNIIIESINNLLLTESQASKSEDQAKRLVMRELNCSREQAHGIVHIQLRNTIPALKDDKCGKFILGVARMYCARQLDDANILSQLNATLKYVASDAYINEYTKNLNELSAQDLIDRFAANIEMDLENDKNKLSQNQYAGVSDYDIVRIDSFEQAKKYYEYTYENSRWCLTYMEGQFQTYTCGGVNQIYFCLKKGFENVEAVPSEGCPLDEYGLSMLSVIVNEKGALVYCTSRWNHSNGGNDNVMNTEQISDVIGMRFYDVFKPNKTWEERVNDAMQRLANGEDPNDIFDFCGNFKHGFARVKLMSKFNFISQNGQLLTWLPTASNSIKGKWFDLDYTFKPSGYALIRMNDRYNLVNQNGQLLTELPTASESIKGKWFDDLSEFEEGFAIAWLNGKCNYINQNGELASKNQWFDWGSGFENGFAEARINKDWYIIDSEGNVNIDNQLCTT